MIQSKCQVSRNFKVEASLTNWESLRFEILKFMKCLELTSKQISTVMILCEEVFVNVSTHSYLSRIGTLELELEWFSDEHVIKITFVDRGVRFNPLEFDENSGEPQKIGGNGILLIKKLSDSQSYRFDGKLNIFSLTKKFD